MINMFHFQEKSEETFMLLKFTMYTWHSTTSVTNF